jgi:hypothetical protein
MDFIDLDDVGRMLQPFQLQSVEILGPASRLLQNPLDRSGSDLADIRRGLHRAAGTIIFCIRV